MTILRLGLITGPIAVLKVLPMPIFCGLQALRVGFDVGKLRKSPIVLRSRGSETGIHRLVRSIDSIDSNNSNASIDSNNSNASFYGKKPEQEFAQLQLGH